MGLRYTAHGLEPLEIEFYTIPYESLRFDTKGEGIS
jgi:hypothetical protein